ncbi:MAG: CoA-binding protein [Candidatus Zixiibacteriota bacterium]
MRPERTHFWEGRSYAVVGVSDKKGRLGTSVLKDLQKRGYQVFAVNRRVKLIGNQKCYGRLRDISGHLDGVVIIAGPEGAKEAIGECISLGVRRVWLFPGRKCDEAIKLAKENGIELIHRACPLLYLQPAEFPHSLHRWIVKSLGRL